MICTSASGLIDGGTAGLIWTYVGTVTFMTCVIASMADMASMAPTSGGQYHWVSEFAPKSSQRFLSYTVGWIGVLGWQAGTASSAFLSGTMIQGLFVLWDETYVPARWQGTLLTIAMALFMAFFNTYGARQLPLLEGLVLCLHIFGFFGILIPLWVLAPKQSATKVFTDFQDGGGWGSIGTACIVGQVAAIYSFVGSDAGTHMSEEIRDASRIVPRSMIATAILNGSLGLVMVITYCFCIPDLESVLASPTGYPFITVFYNATGSKGATTAMTMVLVVLILAAGVSLLATASRQAFAFARDQGLPWPRVWSKVVKVGRLLQIHAHTFYKDLTTYRNRNSIECYSFLPCHNRCTRADQHRLHGCFQLDCQLARIFLVYRLLHLYRLHSSQAPERRATPTKQILSRQICHSSQHHLSSVHHIRPHHVLLPDSQGHHCAVDELVRSCLGSHHRYIKRDLPLPRQESVQGSGRVHQQGIARAAALARSCSIEGYFSRRFAPVIPTAGRRSSVRVSTR